MFEQAVLSGGPASKRVWTTFAGFTGQAVLVTIAVLIPMIWTDSMPGHQTLLRVFMPGVPPGPPPKGEAAPARMTRTVPRQWHDTGLALPTSAPAHPQIIADPPELPLGPGSGTGLPGGIENGVKNGVWASVVESGSHPVLPPKPVEEHHPVAPARPEAGAIPRIKVGGVVHLGPPIRRVEPLYPRMAAMARISGVVELEAVVGIDGRIRELKLKSGSPLLAPAAIDAVRQWIYEPTTLNGEPVEVIAPITVTFRLN